MNEIIINSVKHSFSQVNLMNKSFSKSIIQTCEGLSLEIPRFCYHPQLSIAGNCRMCLVEVQKSLKPAASCAMPILPNMQVFTNSFLVKKSRENVLELLLVNHPLDCPICDQGGECDLQDQTMFYGSDHGRFYEYKRSVNDKNLGPLVKTLMTRCIHCTRCVRFINEIGGISNLGVLGRGSKMEIGTYISSFLDSEFSGNIIDLCPVGALTAKPYAFKHRPWELKSLKTVDILDGFGNSILVYFFNRKIIRILPFVNSLINSPWISDKTRFFFDGLYKQRLVAPLYKYKLSLTKVSRVIENNSNMLITTGSFCYVSWYKIMTELGEAFSLYMDKIRYYYGDLTDLESIVSLKDFMHIFSHKEVYNVYSNMDAKMFLDYRYFYLLNFKFSEFSNGLYDLCLLIGCNPRYEAPLLNLSIRKQVLNNTLIVGSIGYSLNTNYKLYQLGNTSKIFYKFLIGSHWFCSIFFNSKNPLILYGSGLLQRKDGYDFLQGLSCLYQMFQHNFIIKKNIVLSKNFGYLSNNISKINAYETNLYFGGYNFSRLNNVFSSFGSNLNMDLILEQIQDSRFHIFVGASPFEYILNYSASLSNKYLIYVGHHAEKGIQFMNVILPSVSFMEKKSNYLNVFGNLQKSQEIIHTLSNVRLDWEILNFMLFSFISRLLYNDINNLYNRILNFTPLFFINVETQDISIVSKNFLNIFSKEISLNIFHFKLINSSIISKVFNFYLNNSICESSVELNKCSHYTTKKNYNYN